ncbi:G2/M phase-specific E3 ubiquitin-protein ligase isoform X2 [Oryzias latipes]|uniref:G2/M phase-specific E3 ubiquitin-protein ligase isoform X2 n=1 Tax=Oryzias latipes TaxID=8090 RepID=UPI000CE26FC6|nr:G2/M phase-specific E3 ubiquitin-protein ligase isoform X2 [Oryzias latipes]
MFCPFCGVHFGAFVPFCASCGRSLELLRGTEQAGGSDAPGPSGLHSAGISKQKNTNPTYKQFLDYRNSKSKERQSFTHSKVPFKQQCKTVQINIGLMSRQGYDLKAVRGKTLPLNTNPEITAQDLLKRAAIKMATFNKDLGEGPYVLLYPDCTKVVNVPGTERPFTLEEYKKEIGKNYSRITLFICSERHFEGDDTSDSDCEVVITSKSTAEFYHADTVVFEPQDYSTPDPKHIETEEAPGHSSTLQPGQVVTSDMEDLVKSPYSQYTELCAPCIEEEDEDVVEVASPNAHTSVEDTNITLSDIIGNLSHDIDHDRVSRFNISRANVWDGAVRGFKRSSYSETCDMLVNFTDDAGVFEEGLDAGGPKREFLSLLMKHLRDRPIFDGPEGHRFLVYNANAVREDAYYIAGKMIAVSVVHGGPGPHFLSENLVHYLAGQTLFRATVASITEDETRKALQELENSTSVDVLRECLMKHSTMLQTAGCLRHISKIEEKKDIVSDYLRWYIIDRNSSVLDRFKDGLSALHFLDALQQHPTLLCPVLCHTEKQLTGLELERLFKPDFSPSGSNRRLLEGQTVGYWADYLLDCEEGQSPVTLEDVLMFATGLTSLPPSGLDPLPRLQFLDNSMYPMANTCLNTIKLPLLESYTLFKSQMDFGIQNSPGFGCS